MTNAARGFSSDQQMAPRMAIMTIAIIVCMDSPFGRCGQCMLHVTVVCFLASYLVALALELGRLLGRSRISRLVMVAFALAGFLAHTLYLYNRSQKAQLPPLLASAHDWVLVLAWVVALFYLFLALTQKELAVGVFALPVVIL